MLPEISTGMIVSWSGSIVSIPSGWALCDGNNGTPDLTDKFIPGAGDTYTVNDTGGAINHDHIFTGDGHVHEIIGGSDILSDSAINATTTSDAAEGLTDAKSSLPPYYALAYIMKL